MLSQYEVVQKTMFFDEQFTNLAHVFEVLNVFTPAGGVLVHRNMSGVT
jgi:hypothetical protein